MKNKAVVAVGDNERWSEIMKCCGGTVRENEKEKEKIVRLASRWHRDRTL